MKYILSVLFVLICVFFFVSCNLLGPVYSMGGFLNVTGSGHFKEDVIYTYGNSSYTYNADGTYEIILFAYEDIGEDWNYNTVTSEGWVQSGGGRGTYTYDKLTMLMVQSESEGFDGYEWVSDADEYTATMYFTKTEFSNAYLLQEDGSWTGTEKTKFRDDRGTFWYDYSYTYNITETEILYHYLREVKVSHWGAIDLETNYTWQILNSFPEGKEFEKGNTVTFDAVITAGEYREYDWDNDEVSAWTKDTDRYSSSFTFYHGGEFIIFFDDDAARSLARSARH